MKKGHGFPLNFGTFEGFDGMGECLGNVGVCLEVITIDLGIGAHGKRSPVWGKIRSRGGVVQLKQRSQSSRGPEVVRSQKLRMAVARDAVERLSVST